MQQEHSPLLAVQRSILGDYSQQQNVVLHECPRVGVGYLAELCSVNPETPDSAAARSNVLESVHPLILELIPNPNLGLCAVDKGISKHLAPAKDPARYLRVHPCLQSLSASYMALVRRLCIHMT